MQYLKNRIMANKPSNQRAEILDKQKQLEDIKNYVQINEQPTIKDVIMNSNQLENVNNTDTIKSKLMAHIARITSDNDIKHQIYNNIVSRTDDDILRIINQMFPSIINEIKLNPHPLA